MYNASHLLILLNYLHQHDGIADKAKLAELVWRKFSLVIDRSVYCSEHVAIRFCKAKSGSFSNTVLSLSVLQKYDNRPFVVCVVTPNRNHVLLANTTCLAKISHSSHNLRIDNIRGSFNGSDILRSVGGYENAPENFSEIFAMHECFTFAENLERLVESTNSIQSTGHLFEPTPEQHKTIMSAPMRAQQFLASADFCDLQGDLVSRTHAARNEIAIAAFIENTNIRGRLIEYLITGERDSLRELLIGALHDNAPLPQFTTKNELGDYTKHYAQFLTKTDIKTKILFLSSNPKGYNIDKLLGFLAEENSVYMLFIIGIDDSKTLTTGLFSVFQTAILDTTRIIHHWAGRTSRGVTQLSGNSMANLLSDTQQPLDLERATDFLKLLLEHKHEL